MQPPWQSVVANALKTEQASMLIAATAKNGEITDFVSHGGATTKTLFVRLIFVSLFSCVVSLCQVLANSIHDQVVRCLCGSIVA